MTVRKLAIATVAGSLATIATGLIFARAVGRNPDWLGVIAFASLTGGAGGLAGGAVVLTIGGSRPRTVQESIDDRIKLAACDPDIDLADLQRLVDARERLQSTHRTAEPPRTMQSTVGLVP